MGPNLSSTLEPETAPGPGRIPPLRSRYIRFGPFQVDQQREEVTKNGMRLKLQCKVYQVLVALIEKQGEVVTRDELRLRLWPADTHVNYDANVNTTVNKLRQALGDSSDRPLYIETIPRKGYCLIVHPEFTDVPLAVPTSTAVNGVNGNTEPGPNATGAPRSDIWMTLGIIGLILGGMLLGAAITKLWIYHFAPTPGGFWF
jgi:DNA-binding winged helix-turn-helix (wHTH) protein